METNGNARNPICLPVMRSLCQPTWAKRARRGCMTSSLREVSSAWPRNIHGMRAVRKTRSVSDVTRKEQWWVPDRTLNRCSFNWQTHGIFQSISANHTYFSSNALPTPDESGHLLHISKYHIHGAPTVNINHSSWNYSANGAKENNLNRSWSAW